MGWFKPSTKLLLGVAVMCLLIDKLFCAENVMTKEEREELKEEARDIFYHAYRAYMENAYPADELMPLTCKGRYRGQAPSRGDMDDILGNFSLTLIDTLDTLVILGDLEEFEHAVQLVIRDVRFDTDVVVSVFETNIRILGGLLSAHILAEYLQQRAGILHWYQSELLDMAKDLGYRLMPAFNTTTGIPHGKINLRHGLKSNRLGTIRETCTACAGTMILEMAALSRLTGEPIFEEKAHRAMDELWKIRHRGSDLMGTVLNIHSGEWVRRESGVGAGIDSYYEYCLKAYILLGDERYLTRFNRHYTAVMKYISQGPMLLDVHMHRPHTNSKNFMDALLAFWPGLQVLKGDIKPAVETHEMLYQVMQRHKFIPEAFTTDFQVHWGQHPLRPEFLESTYFLHRATGDPYYLHVGRSVLKSLQKYARVPCGYAAVSDVRTGKHEDRMDSFVLAETFKYLFLLFADENELILDLNEFLFTTEAHLLPLTLASPTNYSTVTKDEFDADFDDDDDLAFARTCPNTLHLFPESVRRPLRNMVDGVCPRKNVKRRLTAAEFQVSDPHHLNIAKDMGINILSLSDGRIQLLHSFPSARSISDAEEGLLFMQEMVELSKAQADQPEAQPQGLMFTGREGVVLISAGPSHFGPELRGNARVTGQIAVAHPFRACGPLQDAELLSGRIVMMERGDCMFVDKARRIQDAGALAGIVVDNTPGSSAATSPFFAMSGDGVKDVTIPVVFLFTDDAAQLILAVTANSGMDISIGELTSMKKQLGNSKENTLQIIKAVVGDTSIKRNRERKIKETTVGDFHGSIRDDSIEIKYRKGKALNIIEDSKEVNPVWEFRRGSLLKTIFVYDDHAIFLPLSTASLHYEVYSGATAEELKTADALVHLKWLLKEFQTHLSKHPEIVTDAAKTGPGIEDLVMKLYTEMTRKANALKHLQEILPDIDTRNKDQSSDDIIVKEVKKTIVDSETRTAEPTESNNDEIVTATKQVNDEL